VLELQNQTPFAAILLPTLEPDGSDALLTIVKATYEIRSGGPLELAPQQRAFVMADEFWGEPAMSSLRYASDLVPEKRGTDVVLVGTAHAPRGRATQVDVTLEVGPLRKTVRVIGDRRWRRFLFFSFPSRPEPFATMPLVYERAFGGEDKSRKKPGKWAHEARNPVGRGLVSNPRRKDLRQVLLPNLEDPLHRLTKHSSRPPPACFGFVAPSWEPRRRYAGTYDDGWKTGRCPLLPADFDPRFYNAAAPDLVSDGFLQGGELVRLTNASKDGTLTLRLPIVKVATEFFIDGAVVSQRCDLDTVLLEPDEGQVVLTWRTKVRCHRKIKLVAGARTRTVS